MTPPQQQIQADRATSLAATELAWRRRPPERAQHHCRGGQLANEGAKPTTSADRPNSQLCKINSSAPDHRRSRATGELGNESGQRRQAGNDDGARRTIGQTDNASAPEIRRRPADPAAFLEVKGLLVNGQHRFHRVATGGSKQLESAAY